MIIVSTDSIDKKETETLGLVKGSVVRTKDLGKDIMAGFKTMVGGEIKSYTEMMDEARKIATARMIEDAQNLGADAILAVRYSSAAIMGGAAEIMAYGTAVKFK